MNMEFDLGEHNKALTKTPHPVKAHSSPCRLAELSTGGESLHGAWGSRSYKMDSKWMNPKDESKM